MIVSRSTTDLLALTGFHLLLLPLRSSSIFKEQSDCVSILLQAKFRGPYSFGGLEVFLCHDSWSIPFSSSPPPPPCRDLFIFVLVQSEVFLCRNIFPLVLCLGPFPFVLVQSMTMMALLSMIKDQVLVRSQNKRTIPKRKTSKIGPAHKYPLYSS